MMMRRLLVALAVFVAPLAPSPAHASAPRSYRPFNNTCWWFGRCSIKPGSHFMYRYITINEYGEREMCSVYWHWPTDTTYQLCRPI